MAFLLILAIISTVSNQLNFCFAQGEGEIVSLQPMTGLHSIVAKQAVFDVNAGISLNTTCEVCEAPGTNVSVYWGRDDSATNVPAFVIGGKIKYQGWTSVAAQAIPGVTCGPSGNQNGVRYVVRLLADSLNVGDSGRWWCQLLPNNRSSDWRFAYFTLNVYGSLLSSSDVTLKANETALGAGSPAITVIEGSTTKVACEVNPARLNKNQNATVKWQIEGTSTPLAENQPVFDYVTSVEHFGKQLHCIIDYDCAPNQDSSRCKAPSVIRRIGLNIILKPRVSISAWGPAGMSVSAMGENEEIIGTSSLVGPTRSVLVDEGHSIELHCSAFNSLLHNSRALTGKETYRWFIQEAGTEPTTEPYAVGKRGIPLGPLDRKRDGAIVRCEVDNGHFISKAQLQLSIQYKLSGNAEPTFIGALVGDVISLDCTADDIEADRFVASYQFTWFFGRLQIILPPSDPEKPTLPRNILSFRLANNSQFGNYRCLARNLRSGSQAARNFFVIERGKPQATTSLQIVDAVPRYTASIRCSTFGLPRPTSFRWFRDNATEANNELFDDKNGGKYQIFQKNASSAITESTLVIRHVLETDFGRYICLAGNDFGQVESAYLLTKKESFPTMEIIAGACAGSFILIVLVAVAIYFKCRARNKSNESGANSLKLSETSSSASGGGGHSGGDGSSTSSSSSADGDRHRDSITSPTYTVDVGDKTSPGVATINLQPPPAASTLQPGGGPQGGTFAMSQALTLPSLPHLLPSYHRYADALVEPVSLGGGSGVGFATNESGLVRLSTSVNDNFDDWLKQSRLATFSHLGAYQPSVSFRHPLPPIPPVVPLPAANEQSRLATDV